MTQDRAVRQMAALCHILGLAQFLVPFGGIAASYFLWLYKKDTSEFVDHHGRETVNFQITWGVYELVAVVGVLFTQASWSLLGALMLSNAVGLLWGAYRAIEGLPVRFPVTFEILKRRDLAPGAAPIG